VLKEGELIRRISSVLAALLIHSNFRQMAILGENDPKINVKPDGQAKPAQAHPGSV
jgi:hypothetical protein